ncbi:MAG: tetraacyldisaccharide 4'-kinase [Candidatus Schekmanbacteria bacterium]|nr:tetraacyldisaccharide 4'-kinase [Candidatus Schekmanbacteria bacterium]
MAIFQWDKLINQKHKPNYLLRFLAALYGTGQAVRLFLYDKGIFPSHRLPVKVVCVGNITVGGTGKTPAVIQIAGLLQKNGLKVGIISRGYKRSGEEAVLAVCDGNKLLADWHQAGDEPYLLANELNVPLLVGKNRYAAGCGALAYNPDVLILDDGFQHLKLQRDINLLLINASNPFGNGYTLPAGILREPLTAVKRADVVLLSKADKIANLPQLHNLIRTYNPTSPIFHAAHKPVGLVEVITRQDYKLDWPANKRVAVLSAIGDPASFKNLLVDLGAEVVSENHFPDHHDFLPDELGKVEQQAIETGCMAIITTAKDALRLPLDVVRNFKLPVLVLKIALKIIDKQEEWERFWLAKLGRSLMFRCVPTPKP